MLLPMLCNLDQVREHFLHKYEDQIRLLMFYQHKVHYYKLHHIRCLIRGKQEFLLVLTEEFH